MAVEFGYSNRGKPVVIYRNFEYIKDCENVCGTTFMALSLISAN